MARIWVSRPATCAGQPSHQGDGSQQIVSVSKLESFSWVATSDDVQQKAFKTDRDARFLNFIICMYQDRVFRSWRKDFHWPASWMKPQDCTYMYAACNCTLFTGPHPATAFIRCATKRITWFFFYLVDETHYFS